MGTDEQKHFRKIARGLICPYCEGPSVKVDSAVVYGTSYGPIRICFSCQAWVGFHPGGKTALGRLANHELRQWKKRAHDCFDPLWKRKARLNNLPPNVARSQAYRWLSRKMGTRLKYTHIGMFDLEQCKQVVELCREYHRPKV